MEDDDAWSSSNLDLEEADGSASWRKSNMRISRLTIAFVYALLANTDILCYMLMILNHMVYASVLSMPLPFLVFLWGMLSIPRPTKIFWITVMTYAQVVIVVKYVFKFQFIDINDCNRADGLEKNSPLCPPRMIGIERDGHTSAYDLLLLLVLFFHRYSLKVRLSFVHICTTNLCATHRYGGEHLRVFIGKVRTSSANFGNIHKLIGNVRMIVGRFLEIVGK